MFYYSGFVGLRDVSFFFLGIFCLNIYTIDFFLDESDSSMVVKVVMLEKNRIYKKFV